MIMVVLISLGNEIKSHFGFVVFPTASTVYLSASYQNELEIGDQRGSAR